MYEAIDIANWFLWKNKNEKINNEIDNDEYEVYEELTHLKVQKLLYYAQGVYLAVTNKPLFREEIVAWEHGPVVTEVYEEFKFYGRSAIPFNLNDKNSGAIKDIEDDFEVSNILNLVYDNFGGYTAWQLREKTHVPGGPWEQTVKYKGLGNVIDLTAIKNYFQENVVE